MKRSPAGQFFFWLALCTFSFLLTNSAAAQDKEWRPIDPADLASKAPVVEPGADAEAILWEVRIDDSSELDLAFKHYVRVKIYTERGREKFSKFDVPFLKGVKIKDLAARVIKADGSTVDIKPEDIFEREIVKIDGAKLKAKSFAVPNIEPGVIVEYKYKETISYAGANGLHLEFQKDIPVQRLAYYYKPYSGNTPRSQSYNFTDTKFVKDKDGYWLASRTDIPSIKQEPKMPPEDGVRAWMLLTGARRSLLSYSESVDGFSETYVIKDPGNKNQYWGAVGRQLVGFTELMNKGGGDIKKTALSLTEGLTTADEKLKKLYEFCQSQINNTSFDTTLTDDQRKKLPKETSVGDTLKRKAGSSRFVDMLFGAMAKSIGYDTAIAYSGNRSKMFFTPDMTNEDLIHPAAVAVNVNNEWKFFNPGVKFLPYGMLVWYEEDTYALVVRDKDYSWGQTPYTPYARSTSNRKADLVLHDDGSLEGDVTMEINGQPAVSYRLDNYDETAAKREQSLTDQIKAQINGAEISAVTIDNVMDGNKPLIEKYHVRVPNYAQKTGKRLFLQPNYFAYGLGPVFSSTDRKYDLFFQYPWGENDEINITLPDNFELDNADAPADVADPRKIGELNVKMLLDRAHNTLKYSRKFHFGGGGSVLFGAAMYTPLKGMFDSFHTADTHTLTLKQK
jgi:Domain of Unknown Function with PDB structure (DUF3857)